MRYLIRNFTRNYSNFKGRASQTEFLLTIFFHSIAFALILAIILAIAVYIETDRIFLRRIMSLRASYLVFVTAVPIMGALSLLPLLSLSARRLHDANKPTAALFLLLIPILNFVTFYWLLLPSHPTANRWGEVPPNTAIPPKEGVQNLAKTDATDGESQPVNMEEMQ